MHMVIVLKIISSWKIINTSKMNRVILSKNVSNFSFYQMESYFSTRPWWWDLFCIETSCLVKILFDLVHWNSSYVDVSLHSQTLITLNINQQVCALTPSCLVLIREAENINVIFELNWGWNPRPNPLKAGMATMTPTWWLYIISSNHQS